MKRFFFIGSILTSLAETGLGSPQGSQVLYINDDAHYLLLNQVPSDLRDGDPVCVYHESSLHPYCQASYRLISQKPIVILPAETISRFQTGTIVEIRKIYFSEKKKETSGFVDANTYGHSFHSSLQKDTSLKELQKENSGQPKLPRGSSPSVVLDSTEVTEGEFPEIQIPKINKVAPRTKKEPNETDEIASAIQKSLKDRTKNEFQFVDIRELKNTQKTPPITRSAPQPQSLDIPDVPLHQAIDVSLLQTVPVIPTVSFQGLRYQTITLDSLDRSTLWNKSSNELHPRLGTGLTLNLMRKMTHLVGFGWRYHAYDEAKSRSTYDDLAPNLAATTSTTIAAGAVHAEIGRRYNLLNWLSLESLGGLEVWHSEIWLKSLLVDTDKDSSQALAFARSKFYFMAGRAQGAVKISYHGWGLTLGSILTLPLATFGRSFEGSSVVSERLTYDQDPGNDLKKSLDHKTALIGGEIYLGLSYQPLRD